MPHENPWFLITLHEIAEISRQLRILEQKPAEQYPCEDAIREILVTVVKRCRD